MSLQTPVGNAARPRALAVLFAVALTAIVGVIASAQQFPQLPGSQQQQQQQQAPPPPPPPPKLVARVEGRPITQTSFDRVAQPYFAQLRAQMKQGFTGDVAKLASFNVLDELVRREVLAVEAQRQKIAVAPEETDALLKIDPYFLTNGKFDSTKFNQFKLNPSSNYLEMLPLVRDLVAANKLDQSLRLRFTPSHAVLRAEWAKRNDQVRFVHFPVVLRDISLEPEATEAEWKAYYDSHSDEFQKKTRLRLRYFKLPLPAAGDSTRAAAESLATIRGRGIADSLRARTLPDSSAGMTDTGPFEVPAAFVPGLAPTAELGAALAQADSDTTVRVLGPTSAPDGVIVGAIV